MTVPMWITLGVALLAAIVSAFAVALALRSFARPIKHIASITQLRTEFAEVVDDLEKLQHLVASKSKRDVMREKRANGVDPIKMRPGESSSEWKARMRAGVRTGEINPPRFRG